MSKDVTARKRDSMFRQRVAVVAEDDEGALELVRDFLAQLGFAVIALETAEDAIAAARNHIVDLAVVDVFMPGKGGIWMVSEIPNWFPEAKIISISGGWGALTPEKAVEAAESVGANAVLTKPFKFEELKRIIDQLMGLPPEIGRAPTFDEAVKDTVATDGDNDN